MGVNTALRFDPVTCVVTLKLAETDELRMYGIIPGSGLIHIEANDSQHYKVTHGSVVCLGEPQRAFQDADVAVVFDLPTGWLRSAGKARVRMRNDGLVELKMETATPAGEIVTMSVTCRSIGYEPSVHTLTGTS